MPEFLGREAALELDCIYHDHYCNPTAHDLIHDSRIHSDSAKQCKEFCQK